MKLITTTFILFSMASFAADKSTNLEDQKVLSNNELDAAISRLEEHRPCVRKAKTTEALKGCRKDLRADLKELSESIKETREDIKDFHKKKL